MAAPAAIDIQRQDLVELFGNQPSVQGSQLVSVLNNLAGICFGTKGHGSVPGAIDQLPHLNPLPWESSMPWTGRKLEPIDPRVFKNFPVMGLKSGGAVVGVACYIATLRKVIVYTVKDFLVCEENSIGNPQTK